MKFKVKDSAPPGYYTIYLNLSYLRDGEIISQKKTIEVPVSIGQKNLVVDLNPKTISPGNQTNITYSITNNGLTPVSDVLLTWSESTGLVLPLGSDNRNFVSRINPGETVDVNYLVATDPNITTGIYPLEVTLSYSDSNGAQTQKSTIGIIAGGKTDFDVSSDYTNSQLSFSIANVGSNNAAAVVVKISPQPGLNITGSNTVIIGALNKGDYSIANFTVSSASDTNASGGSFRRGGSASGVSGASSALGLTGSANVNSSESSQGTSSVDRNFSGGAGQLPSSYVVEIDYTDTTGARQQVMKNFSINSRTTGFAIGAASSGASAFGTDWVTILAAIAVVAVIGVGYNKVRAKKNWKQLGIFVAVAIVVPVVAVYFAPRTLVTPILCVAVIAVALVVFFAGRGK